MDKFTLTLILKKLEIKSLCLKNSIGTNKFVINDLTSFAN